MSCEKMEGRILSYIDGRLKENDRPEVEKHLATCASCQLRVEEFRAVSGLLDELPVIEPSPAFDARVHALVAAEPRETELVGMAACFAACGICDVHFACGCALAWI